MTKPGKSIDRRSLFRVFAAASAAGFSPGLLNASHAATGNDDHIKWVVEVLERMKTITPGMSRIQLLAVFTVEGGISTALQRTFVSRDCPYFKVNVTFRRAHLRDPGEGTKDILAENDDDEIVTISQPYLQFEIMD